VCVVHKRQQFALLDWLLYLVAELVVVVHLMHVIQEELLLGAELVYQLLPQLGCELVLVFQDPQLLPQLGCELVLVY